MFLEPQLLPSLSRKRPAPDSPPEVSMLHSIESPPFCQDLHHYEEHKKIVRRVKFEVQKI
jgi:hypothetical protein